MKSKDMMTESIHDCLNEKAQCLLMEYADGSCKWWNRLRARHMLSRSAAARGFVTELQALSSELRLDKPPLNKAQVDLWEKVNVRIEQEEHAAFYLGERRLDGRQTKSEFNWKQSWLIGAPAGAMAALLAVLVIGQGTNNGDLANNIGQQAVFSGQTFNGQQSNIVTPVAQSVGSSSHSANELEMEWLRSHGRVQMIPHSNGQTPVIWISRTDAIRQWQAANRAKVMSSVPTRNSNGIEIIERNIPNALTVAK